MFSPPSADHLGAPPAREQALDFGCGVGRLVLPLARRFGAVVGVDVSEAYLAEAARNRDRKGLTNIEFADNLDAAAARRQFDLVHSYIVFNHIPWRRGKGLIAELFGLLRQNGILAVHVLHRRHAGRMRRAVSWASRNFLPLHWLINLGRGRPCGNRSCKATNTPSTNCCRFWTLSARKVSTSGSRPFLAAILSLSSSAPKAERPAI